MYVDYVPELGAPEFELYVGINLWTTVSVRNASLPGWTEIVVVATGDFIPVCLVNTGKGDPFISALEARLIRDSMYGAASHNQSLLALWIHDAGSTSEKIIRYPDDKYDRLWVPYTDPSWASISTSLVVDNFYLGFEPSSAVMKTAATPLNANDPVLYFNWTANYSSTEFHIFRHFADFQKPNGSATFREIDCCNNGHSCFPFSPEYLVSATVYTINPMTENRNYSISFSKTEKSVLPPILNAFEIYIVLSLDEAATDEKDVHAMMRIKDVYGLQNNNWMGDPCLPSKYLWGGLTCSYNSDHPPRITSLNLSSSGLTGKVDASFGNFTQIQSLDLSKNNLRGPIPTFLAKLTALSQLDLSRNNLTGEIPDFLATLRSLTFLNLSSNNFTGSLPSTLLQMSKAGTLHLSIDNNPNLSSDPCSDGSCKKKKRGFPVVRAISLSVSVFLLLVSIFFILRRKYERIRERRSLQLVPVVKSSDPLLVLDNHRFSHADIINMTNNFVRILGKGGFGVVYHGEMDDGTQVAVKMLARNCPDCSEFQAEAQLMMKVCHRNLVQLIGYFSEGDKMALILEYMSEGHLGNLLKDNDRGNPTWVQRIRIALDIAQGLEYLHVGCRPPIIHRDVKAANILLNERLDAKIADFGLSKVFYKDQNDEFAHITTAVKGTFGYLDPEYFFSHILSEKSDVYSYGVVLLELITGKSAILHTCSDHSLRVSLVEWVSPFVSMGNITDVIDGRLGGKYDVNSAKEAIEIAVACTRPKGVDRPTMSGVVTELKRLLGSSGHIITPERTTEFFSTDQEHDHTS
ncbi:hypothetical protein H6P81_001035 [Aristolochia fimbriata]|uniref:non-specific serine/threonine protein kinase n=1 Tax=Aristolochia fimbriata TaxID=158543 RepID=A0AAV7F9R8_ARIFI|nr:hypothetical protein H6P81_001035 [Aristolochia fimbriata]